MPLDFDNGLYQLDLDDGAWVIQVCELTAPAVEVYSRGFGPGLTVTPTGDVVVDVSHEEAIAGYPRTRTIPGYVLRTALDVWDRASR